MDVQINDILKAKKTAEDFLTMNGMDIYVDDTSKGWGVYVNGVTKNIGIHSPSSSRWKSTSSSGNILTDNVFTSPNKKPNSMTVDIWIGGFKDIATAYTFADIMRRVIYLDTGNEFVMSAGRRTGIKFPMGRRLF